MITIKELLPNPSGEDATNEWIRLINAGEEAITPKGLILADASGKTFKLDSIGPIQGNETIELKRTTTGIALNNDGDTVYIRTVNGDVVDQLSYGANVGEEEIVTADSFKTMPVARTSLEDGAANFGIVAYQAGITPILVGLSIAIVSSALVWVLLNKHEEENRN